MARLSRQRRAILAASLAGVIGAAVSIPLLLLGGGSPSDGDHQAQRANELLPPNSVGVIDPATNSVVARIRVGRKPLDVVFANGSVWVANLDEDTVMRIDPKTRRVVKTIGVGVEPTGLAAGDGAVWVTNGFDGTLKRIDPATDKVEQTIRLRPKLGAGQRPFFRNDWNHLVGGPAWMPVAAGGGSVWVGDPDSFRILRVDPRKHKVVETIDDYDPKFLAVAPDGLWVINYGLREIVRIDPESKNVLTRAQIGIRDGLEPKVLSVADGTVWVANSRLNFIWRIDALSGAISGKVEVGYRPAAMVAGPTSVWVANWTDHTVSKIDRRTSKVVATIQLGRNVGGVALGDGAVWVAAQ